MYMLVDSKSRNIGTSLPNKTCPDKMNPPKSKQNKTQNHPMSESAFEMELERIRSLS